MTNTRHDRLWVRVGAILALAVALMTLLDTDNGPAAIVLPLLAAPVLTLVVHGLWFRLPAEALLIGAVTTPVILMYFGYAEGTIFYLILVTLLVAKETEPRERANIICTIVLFQPIIAARILQLEISWLFWVSGIVLAWIFGSIGRMNTSLLSELTATRQQMVDQAILMERRRIAQDVHDLVGHSLTVVLLHITGARRSLHRNPDVAEEALASAERVGRESLSEIRRSVGLLRTDGSEDTKPSPSGQDLAGLIQENERAGQPITLETSGDLARLSGALGLAAYRVVQESIANAVKHAPGQPVEVLVSVRNDDCLLIVENPLGPKPTTSSDRRLIGAMDDEGGYGLIGMRERVNAVGGTLVVGPAGRQWRVEATFPLLTDSVAAF